MPGFVIGSPQSLVGEAWVGATDSTSSGATLSPPHVSSGATFPALQLTYLYKPASFGPSASVAAPSLRRIAAPAGWSNTPAIQTPRISFVVRSAAFIGGQAFLAAAAKQTLQTASFASGPVFNGPRLVLRISAAAFANTAQFYASAVSQGTAPKSVPHLPSTAVVFAPALIHPVTTSVTVTLNLPGLISRAPKAPLRRAAATWPNLPKVAAPPWRLTVVTPDIARERARQRMAAFKRAERQRHKRKADEHTNEIVDALIDETVIHTIARVVAERA